MNFEPKQLIDFIFPGVLISYQHILIPAKCRNVNEVCEHIFLGFKKESITRECLHNGSLCTPPPAIVLHDDGVHDVIHYPSYTQYPVANNLVVLRLKEPIVHPKGSNGMFSDRYLAFLIV